MADLQGDALFLEDEVAEWYKGGESSSAHDKYSIKWMELPYSYVLFCYPRDYTPVCTKELVTLQQKLEKFGNLEVIAASTDSPESHARFFNDDDAFPVDDVPNIEYAVLTLRDHMLTPKGQELLLNEYGYCNRIAVVVKEGKIHAIYQTSNEKPRSIDGLVSMLE